MTGHTTLAPAPADDSSPPPASIHLPEQQFPPQRKLKKTLQRSLGKKKKKFNSNHRSPHVLHFFRLAARLIGFINFIDLHSMTEWEEYEKEGFACKH